MMKPKAKHTREVEIAAVPSDTPIAPDRIEQLDVRESAKYMHLTASTIRAWVHLRKIPSIKLGRRVLLRRCDLDRLILASVRPAAEDVEVAAGVV